MGYVCDRVKPARLVVGGVVLYSVTMVLAYFFVHDRNGWWIYTVLSAIPACAWGLGSAALSMELFPRAGYGQFSAGLNVFGCGRLILGNYLIGAFMDLIHSNYQMVFVWSAIIFALALFPIWQVYRGWQQHGGPEHYVPPLPRDFC
jgi:maltose/moltooligosaccharide transporter